MVMAGPGYLHWTFTENLLLAEGGIPLLGRPRYLHRRGLAPGHAQVVAHVEPRDLVHPQLSALNYLHLEATGSCQALDTISWDLVRSDVGVTGNSVGGDGHAVVDGLVMVRLVIVVQGLYCRTACQWPTFFPPMTISSLSSLRHTMWGCGYPEASHDNVTFSFSRTTCGRVARRQEQGSKV